MNIRVFFFLFVLAAMPQRLEAQLYHFAEIESTGGFNVLAILELSTLPASHGDVVSLEFTPEGVSRFGFGRTYESLFDFTNNPLAEDGFGGLTGLGGNPGEIADLMPPDSLLHPDSGTSSVLIRANTFTPDSFEILPVDPMADPTISVNGEWLVVPEPSALPLLLAGSLVISLTRSRSRKGDRTIG